MSAAEQIILTVSANGYGKRTSSYEYRITGRGGKGIVAMAVNQRNGKLVASMPVEDGDEIMLVTNGGQLIRCPVDGIRVAGRGTQGVIVFDTAADEQVVAVERISEEDAARRRRGPAREEAERDDGRRQLNGDVLERMAREPRLSLGKMPSLRRRAGDANSARIGHAEQRLGPADRLPIRCSRSHDPARRPHLRDRAAPRRRD